MKLKSDENMSTKKIVAKDLGFTDTMGGGGLPLGNCPLGGSGGPSSLGWGGTGGGGRVCFIFNSISVSGHEWMCVCVFNHNSTQKQQSREACMHLF